MCTSKIVEFFLTLLVFSFSGLITFLYSIEELIEVKSLQFFSLNKIWVGFIVIVVRTTVKKLLGLISGLSDLINIYFFKVFLQVQRNEEIKNYEFCSATIAELFTKRTIRFCNLVKPEINLVEYFSLLKTFNTIIYELKSSFKLLFKTKIVRKSICDCAIR